MGVSFGMGKYVKGCSDKSWSFVRSRRRHALPSANIHEQFLHHQPVPLSSFEKLDLLWYNPSLFQRVMMLFFQLFLLLVSGFVLFLLSVVMVGGALHIVSLSRHILGL